MVNLDDKVILGDLKDITRNRECWKANIVDVASYLNNDYSIEVSKSIMAPWRNGT